jgi:hypothetical protein
LAVAVCATLSLFFQVAVPPTANTIGFGEYAVVVNAEEPLTIDTLFTDGVEGVIGLDDEPHAAEAISTTDISISRIFMLAPVVGRARGLPQSHTAEGA